MEPRIDVNWQRSKEIADSLCLEKGQCYRNAVIALLSFPALQAEGFVYVEGYALAVIAIPHGWLANDREILDPTLCLTRRSAHQVQYFAAVSYPWQEVEELSSRLETPFVARDKRGGHSIAVYNEAERAALEAMMNYESSKGFSNH